MVSRRMRGGSHGQYQVWRAIYKAEREMKHAPRDVPVQIRAGYFGNDFPEVRNFYLKNLTKLEKLKNN
jgi:hypothetical protein